MPGFSLYSLAVIYANNFTRFISDRVVSVLTRNGIAKNDIKQLLLDIKNLGIEILEFTPLEWLDEIHLLAKKIQLKSMDLFIVVATQVFKISHFASLDLKQMNAYNKIN